MTGVGFCLLFAVAYIAACHSQQITSSVANKLKIVFAYPTNVTSERDLRICEARAACNIVYKRFWMPPLVERLCRCQSRNECPWSWSKKPDNSTITLNNRSQMKFCSDLSTLPACAPRKPALLAVSETQEDSLPSPYQHSVQSGKKLERHTKSKNLTALCQCQDPHYWKLLANRTTLDEETSQQQQQYLCSKLRKCAPQEFCGYVRQDSYSTYYRCSCPKGYMCISKDKILHKVEELLYNGTGYKAYCYPQSKL